MRRAAVALLVTALAWAVASAAMSQRIELRPSAAGWRLLQGAAPRGMVVGRAGLVLPGLDRGRSFELRLTAEPGASRPSGLELRLDGEVVGRRQFGTAGELRLRFPASRVDGLRLDLAVEGGPLLIKSLEVLPDDAKARPAPASVALLSLGALLLAWRAHRRAAVALALLAAALASLTASLPLGLLAWPANWHALSPALLVALSASIWGLRRSGRAFARDSGLLLALVFGAAFRLLFLYSTGSWDTEYWKAWMHRSMEAGLTQAYGPGEAVPAGHALAQFRGEEEAWKVDWHGRLFVVDYPPLAMAVWAASGCLVGVLAPRLSGLERDNLAVKLPALLGDLLALGVLPWACRPRWRRGLSLAAIYWILPVSWLSSAVLGYLDGLLPPLLVVALMAAGSGRGVMAGAVLALAVMIKPTAAIVAPAVLLALWRARAQLARCALSAMTVAALIFLPYALAGTLVTAMVHCARLFLQERLSGGYPNLWWLLGHAMTYTSAHGIAGPVAFAHIKLLLPLPARAVGALLFVLSAAHLLRRQPAGPRGACLVGALLFVAYGMLGVGVHENHPHPLFLLMLATGLPTRRGRVLFTVLATVYVLDMLSLSGLGRFHGPRYLWLLPFADAVGRLRMALGFDLTLALAFLNVLGFAAALAWAGGEAVRLEGDRLPAGDRPPGTPRFAMGAPSER